MRRGSKGFEERNEKVGVRTTLPAKATTMISRLNCMATANNIERSSLNPVESDANGENDFVFAFISSQLHVQAG